MAGEWRDITLGATVDFLSGGTPSKSNPDYWDGAVPWLSAKDMKSFRVYDTEDHVTDIGVENGTKIVPPGTIFLLSRGMTLLNDIPICVARKAMSFNQDVKALRVKPGLREDYLAYLLLSLKPRLLDMVDLAGHGTGRLNTDELKSIRIHVPIHDDEQRAIAHILGTLDDKIELNRRMNETLEAIARAIFKSWFVDFDPVRAKASGEAPESICRRLGLTPDLLALFPDRLVDSELGEIPEGWQIRTVEDLSLKVGMGPFGSNIKVSTFVEQGIPIISGQHLNDTMLEDNTFRFISVEHADRLASANVGRGDIVFTHAGNIGQVSYIPDHSQYVRYILSQRQFYLRCDLSRISPLFMVYFFRSPQGQHKLLANATQVGVPSIARPVSYLKSIDLVTPPRLLADKYDEIVRPLHHRIAIVRTEIETLSGLRDTLLPKLLSGELRVPVAGPA